MSIFQTSTYPTAGDRWTTYTGNITAITDADTMKAELHIRTGPDDATARRIKLRLAHIDAPERYTPEGRAAIDYAHELVPDGATATITDLGPDKYGRRLAQVTIAGRNISEEMLKTGHAAPYEGGTRTTTPH